MCVVLVRGPWMGTGITKGQHKRLMVTVEFDNSNRSIAIWTFLHLENNPSNYAHWDFLGYHVFLRNAVPT
jgi:hypothetical protein